MNNTEKSLRKLLHSVVRSRRQRLVHLTCRTCGTEAFAATVTIARGFGGWSTLRHKSRKRYTGLCIECSPPIARSYRKKRREP